MHLPQFCHYPSHPLPLLQPVPELHTLDPHACSYFPDRVEQIRVIAAARLAPDAYHAMMNASFRRSGRYVYQPICPHCRDCIPLRVPVADFAPGKSQRRCQRKNADLIITVAPPEPTAEKHAIYVNYQTAWHTGKQPSDFASFVDFLYASPVDTLEFTYRAPTGQLLAAGLCDLSAESLSSVYFYFDPAAAARSLGTFSALYEIAWARQHNIPHWYAGFFVPGCSTMSYKSNFRPHELLGPDGIWRAP